MSNVVTASRPGRSGASAPAAPPVVAVVVVHEPGEWFDETLDSLVRQDYPNLSTLFLLAGTARADDGSDVRSRITARLPDAFVELVDANPGYGTIANLVLNVVDGDHGFFCLMHDDVVLAPAAIRLMTEELYRSNAGIVGPKLVTWDNPMVLADVGLDVDRFGAVSSRVDPGEYDQEQHDVATEVFAVPSACMLVRADLFRALDGFDEVMRFHGEDVDLCWRARISGARVVVAPAARVRHRGELELRRPDLNHRVLKARHRMRAAITLTPGPQLPLRLLQLVAVTLAELVVAPFSGHAGSGLASLRALLGAIPRFPTMLARRGTIARQRGAAGDGTDRANELHVSGSAQLRNLRRLGEMRTLVGIEQNIRRWRETSVAPVVTWVLVVVGAVLATRGLIRGGVPVIGEFLRLPDSAGELWGLYRSGWNGAGLGDTAPNPTGLAALAVASILWLFSMGAGMVVLIIALVVFGGFGVWRLADVFPSNRERIVALVVYLATPLLPALVSTGRLGGLVTFAFLPWFVQLLRSAVGIATADPASEAADLADGVQELAPRERVRRVAVTALVLAFGCALAPQLWYVALVVVVVVAGATLLVGGDRLVAVWMLGSGAAAVAVAWILNLPASTTWSLERLAAPELAGPPGLGVGHVATFDIGASRFNVIAIALYLPVIVALALSRAWRLSWAARGAALVVVFGALALHADQGALRLPLVDIGFLLVPVALGLALSAAVAVASFGRDVAGGSFGWRQPAGVLGIAAVVVGVLPGLLTVADGRWYMPTGTVAQLVGSELHAESSVRDTADQRVLYLGDSRMLPGAPTDIGDGVALLVTEPEVPGIEHRWVPPRTAADRSLADALDEIASGRTRYGGRLLAPFGIRYIVVPIFDGAYSTPDVPLPIPEGLTGALEAQLDLEIRWTAPHYRLFVNRSSFPVAGLLTGAGVGVTRAGSINGAAQPGVTVSAPFGRVLTDGIGAGEVTPGVVHLAVPYSTQWQLTVGTTAIPARPSVGGLTAFDVDGAGIATLRYVEPSGRVAVLVLQAVAIIAVLVAASRARVPHVLMRRRVATAHGDQSVLDLDAFDSAAMPGGDDRTAPLFRPIAIAPADDARRASGGGPDMMGGLFDSPGGALEALGSEPGTDDRRAAAAAAWVDDLFGDDAFDEDSFDDDGAGGGR